MSSQERVDLLADYFASAYEEQFDFLSYNNVGNFIRMGLNLSFLSLKFFKPLLLTMIFFKGILTTYQHCFLENHSVMTNLLSSDVHLVSALTEGFILCCWLYMDFSKEFDRVNHNLLMSKLKQYSLHGFMYDWLRSYLTDRQQQVNIDGSRSYCSVF